ncbi:hypothetical protein BRD09_00670 [Halobacteriales archaeon SW_10_68_16]|jgi:hypothetical protein|nr:MAG: hypothetical protein BRD09_00670 [Halobacteriales archaeon SW_10_68_16]
MDPAPDELAGVVDLFGALTPSELRRALAELAFKRGEDDDPDRFGPAVADARQSYHLVAVDADEAGVDVSEADDPLVVGPVAFPTLPEGARDLPHILDIPERDPDREAVTGAAATRFRADAAGAIDDGDTERIRTLLDTSYELETWGGMDLSVTRERMDDELTRDR